MDRSAISTLRTRDARDLLRVHGPFVLLVVLALVSRAWALGAVPTPAGDEGNWAGMALRFSRGQPAGLPPDAAFVTTAFARAVGLVYRAFGVSFAGARAVLVVGVLCAMVLSYALCAAMGARRAGLVVAAVLALHPWSVLWSRTASVPYALSLAIGTAAPIAWLAALRAPPGWRRTLALFVAMQLLAAGFHFSPLALAPAVACGLWVFAWPEHRALLRTPSLWVASVFALAHATPIVLAALRVARTQGAPSSATTESVGDRVGQLACAMLDGLSGDATLRHFVGDGSEPSAFGRAAVAMLVTTAVLALVRAWRARRQASDHGAIEMGTFALVYLPVSLVVMPLLLSRARDWHLPTIDGERYHFAILAPVTLLAGGTAACGGRAVRVVIWSFVLYLALGPTSRALRYFALGGGPDRGLYVARGGGGYRGWKVARGHVSLPELVYDEVARRAGSEQAIVLVDDYSFHPLRVLVGARGPAGLRVVNARDAILPAGRRVFALVWPDEIFASGFDPAYTVQRNREFRERLRREFKDARLVREFVQPDGWPLVDLWEARAPTTR